MCSKIKTKKIQHLLDFALSIFVGVMLISDLIVYNCAEVIKVSEKRIKVDCRLTTKGDASVDRKIIEDLAVEDPDMAMGECIIKKFVKKDDSTDDS